MRIDTNPICFWAKLSHASTNDIAASLSLSLISHSIDVAIVFRHLMDIPSFRRQLEQTTAQPLTECQLDRLSVMAMLHDLGKANWGFQAKRNPKATVTTGHILPAGSFLMDDRIYRRWPESWQSFLEEAVTWFRSEEALFQMLVAALSHHGKPLSQQDIDRSNRLDRWWEPHDGLDPMNGIEQLVAAIREQFPIAFSQSAPPVNACAAFQHRFAGMVMLADWIGSDIRFFPLGIECNRRTTAEAGAMRALKTIGLIHERLSSLPPFEGCFPEWFSPTPLQQAVDRLQIQEDTRLVLVESDTGSGKTEAALRWFWRLFADNRVDGLYFALPTRVAARELYGRIVDSVQTVFPDPEQRPSPVLLAVPGYIQVDGESAVLPQPDMHLWEDDPSLALAERFWAAERPKRFLAAPIAVGTIDQAMLSAMKVKHSLLRSVCLDRHLLVVDEVHASDTYMSVILAHLLRGHLQRGGFAMLLSATLGESARASYFDTSSLSMIQAVERPYPSLTTRAEEICIEKPKEARSKVVYPHLLASLEADAVLPKLREGLSAGAKILVICNTVDRAIHLLKAVESSDIDPAWLFRYNDIVCPHHGRYCPSDRKRLDRAVSKRFGKQTQAGPVLLIGTQTLEQSLDIDADFMITDLAPIDVLLQRIGRLHRHRRSRPEGFQTAHVWIRIPDRPLHTFLRPDGRLKGPAGIGSVYEDGIILQRTIDVLQNTEHLILPDQNRYLVETCTHEDAWDFLPKSDWQRHRDWLWGPRLADLRQADSALLPNEHFGELHYPDDGRKILTRLGDGTISVPLANPMQTPFGNTIREVPLPFWFLPEGSNDIQAIAAETLPDTDGFRFEVAGRFFRYTRYGLERHHDESAD